MPGYELINFKEKEPSINSLKIQSILLIKIKSLHLSLRLKTGQKQNIVKLLQVELLQLKLLSRLLG